MLDKILKEKDTSKRRRKIKEEFSDIDQCMENLVWQILNLLSAKSVFFEETFPVGAKVFLTIFKSIDHFYCNSYENANFKPLRFSLADVKDPHSCLLRIALERENYREKESFTKELFHFRYKYLAPLYKSYIEKPQAHRDDGTG